jgi:hypothetical protein
MSLAEDPKETLKSLLRNNVTLYKDDNVTVASLCVTDEFNEEFWKKYDVIITVGLANSHERFVNLTGSLREVVANYHVGIWTRDLLGINGKGMRWKAIQEVSRVINEHMKNPGGILVWMKLTNCVDADKTSLKPVLYNSVVTVETHRYETV